MKIPNFQTRADEKRFFAEETYENLFIPNHPDLFRVK
jgi:hypothetical protein